MNITIVWMFTSGLMSAPVIIGIYIGPVETFTSDEELMHLASMFGVYFTSSKLGKTMYNKDTMRELTDMLEARSKENDR